MVLENTVSIIKHWSLNFHIFFLVLDNLPIFTFMLYKNLQLYVKDWIIKYTTDSM